MGLALASGSCPHPHPPAHTPPPPHTSPCQVRLWDLRVNGCQALLEAPGLPTTTFDEQGLVFAVGAERGVVKLYDARNWAAGPFTSFPVRACPPPRAGRPPACGPCLQRPVSCGRMPPTSALPDPHHHPPTHTHTHSTLLRRSTTRSTLAPCSPASSSAWTAACCWRWPRGGCTCWRRLMAGSCRRWAGTLPAHSCCKMLWRTVERGAVTDTALPARPPRAAGWAGPSRLERRGSSGRGRGRRQAGQRACPPLPPPPPQIINPGVGEGGQALEACLTPDAKYVMSGSPDNSIRAWSVASGAEVARWTGHAGLPTCLKVRGRRPAAARCVGSVCSSACCQGGVGSSCSPCCCCC